ncbi:hypothetical protein CJ469_01570 [Nocardia farcinica]|uniref:NfeD family protein n=1 Tax=Nocardia farcinica TaxID=37329 RepID=UPI000BF8860C|nr:NfeD family protein [Nocardia farcinica]PFX03696.1 hypothetical protein CJ469_01570 [Nocardia farcinica]PFX09854.1 hypothetical protein CJ468_00701 [Nocardia farcinica]
MAAIAWLVAGILLAAAEMLVGDLTLLMIGVAALGTAGVSAAADTSVIVDAVVFGVITLVLLLGVRPVLRRQFGTPPPVPTNVHALPGKTALVLEEVTDTAGLVKLAGEVWTARPMNQGDVFEPGTTVSVMEIDGATAVVWKGP